MIFKAISFRDNGVKKRKKFRPERYELVFQPIHLVPSLTEPEAHLHGASTKVFI